MELLNEQQPWSNKRAAVELAPPPSRSVGQGDVKDSQSSILFGVNIEQRSLLGDDSPAGAFGPMGYRCGPEAAQLLDEPPPALLEVKPHDGTFLKVYTLAPIHFIPFWFSLLAVCASIWFFRCTRRGAAGGCWTLQLPGVSQRARAHVRPRGPAGGPSVQGQSAARKQGDGDREEQTGKRAWERTYTESESIGYRDREKSGERETVGVRKRRDREGFSFRERVISACWQRVPPKAGLNRENWFF